MNNEVFHAGDKVIYVGDKVIFETSIFKRVYIVGEVKGDKLRLNGRRCFWNSSMFTLVGKANMDNQNGKSKPMYNIKDLVEGYDFTATLSTKFIIGPKYEENLKGIIHICEYQSRQALFLIKDTGRYGSRCRCTRFSHKNMWVIKINNDGTLDLDSSTISNFRIPLIDREREESILNQDKSVIYI